MLLASPKEKQTIYTKKLRSVNNSTASAMFLFAHVGRFGRKIPFYFGGLALVGGGFGIAFTSNLYTLNVCRFILGIARMAVFVNGIVIGEKARSQCHAQSVR